MSIFAVEYKLGYSTPPPTHFPLCSVLMPWVYFSLHHGSYRTTTIQLTWKVYRRLFLAHSCGNCWVPWMLQWWCLQAHVLISQTIQIDDRRMWYMMADKIQWNIEGVHTHVLCVNSYCTNHVPITSENEYEHLSFRKYSLIVAETQCTADKIYGNTEGDHKTLCAKS